MATKTWQEYLLELQIYNAAKALMSKEEREGAQPADPPERPAPSGAQESGE